MTNTTPSQTNPEGTRPNTTASDGSVLNGSVSAEAPNSASDLPSANHRVIGTVLTDQPLEPLRDEASGLVPDATAGAVVTFDGIIRNHDGGQAVDELLYTAHPSARQELARVVAEIAAEFPQVRVWAAHRTGKLGIGELAFAVIVASAHRKEAFAACAELAERVKATVPIWKEQFLSDGRAQWVGLD